MNSTLIRRCAAASFFVAAFIVGTAYAAPVAVWKYYQAPGSLGTDAREASKPGGSPHAKAQLFQGTDGAYTFRIQGGSTDECFVRETAASVEKTQATTIITPAPRFAACPRIRLVIKNDGSGGTVELNMGKRGVDAWQPDDDHEYDLKPL